MVFTRGLLVGRGVGVRVCSGLARRGCGCCGCCCLLSHAPSQSAPVFSLRCDRSSEPNMPPSTRSLSNSPPRCSCINVTAEGAAKDGCLETHAGNFNQQAVRSPSARRLPLWHCNIEAEYGHAWLTL